MRQNGRMKRVAILLTGLMLLAGCRTPPTLTYAIDAADVCFSFGIVNYSRNDTPLTVRQIVGHNAAHDEFCSTQESIVDLRDVCGVFVPISYSRDDTMPTRRSLIGHNAAHTALCSELAQ